MLKAKIAIETFIEGERTRFEPGETVFGLHLSDEIALKASGAIVDTEEIAEEAEFARLKEGEAAKVFQGARRYVQLQNESLTQGVAPTGAEGGATTGSGADGTQQAQNESLTQDIAPPSAEGSATTGSGADGTQQAQNESLTQDIAPTSAEGSATTGSGADGTQQAQNESLTQDIAPTGAEGSATTGSGADGAQQTGAPPGGAKPILKQSPKRAAKSPGRKNT
ncbi:MAG: hypothetical protein ABS43_03600 [Bordetella sp. SCN 67-23]|nr:hypothetical protein [Burkholderiales bacterium]ODS75887.1 MAG: hypothetical protein ABS43_03600 [Bordetella sp. SCN 67-23]OJW91763.1 MAG: hypothetical protein BGO71_21630 [Burkholderiales bacterium 67-32]